MSEENAELIRSAFAAYEKRNYERLADTFADEPTMTGPSQWPEQGPFEGKPAVLEQFKRLASDWQNHGFSGFRVVADEEDWIVMEFRWHARGAGSGIETTFDMTSAHQIEGGRQVAVHFRWNRAQALRAAGLSE